MGNWNIKSGFGSLPNKNIIQNVKVTQVSGPTISIVTRSEVKNYLKLGSDTTDDNLLDDLAKTATGIIERELGGIAICEQTWKQYQQGGCETIKLMRGPVIGVPTVSYYEDFDTVTATNITYTSYCRVIDNEITHVDGYFEEGREGDGYTITYKAGMFTASDYTNSSKQELQAFKTAILRTIAYLYENREEHVVAVSEGNWKVTYSGDLPEGVRRIIMPFHSGEGLI